jgi:glycosyltransferase involved in cell wall biosynthesis
MASAARLKILHVVCSDAFAGVEHYVAYTATALSMLGHSVSVIGGDPGAMISMLKPSGVQFIPGPNEWEAVRMLSSIAIWRNQPDLVHVHMTKAEFAAVVTKPLLRRPVVTTLHFARTRGSTPLRRQLWRSLANFIDAQIAISDYVAQTAEQDCVVLPPGVPTPILGGHSGQPVGRQPVVLVAQRFEPEKRTISAIAIWAAGGLAKQGWELHLAGEGPDELALRGETIRLGVDQSVRFLGFVDDLPARMQEASILLATGDRDSLGLSVVEAMAAALPVVAARAGGHLETVGPVTSNFLYDPVDTEAGGAALRRLALDPVGRQSYGRALRSRYKDEYTVERHARSLIEIYQRVLNG